MKVLLVHPSGLMYTEVYLRLEPLGLERVAESCRRAGHEVRLLDLQVFKHRHFRRLLESWRPDAVAFSLNYLANIPEVVDLARELRELTNVALALEAAPDELRALTEQIRAAREVLARNLPADLTPRIGTNPDPGQRVYVDHSRDVGDFNPCFPRYSLTCVDDRADGEVEFPLCYEGPPGIVHGGFLAVFFDLVLQQLNCDLGVAGKTVTIAMRFRRPTPLLRRLRVTAHRTVDGDRIHSEGELYDGDELLCTAEMSAVAGRVENLPAVSPRRTS